MGEVTVVTNALRAEAKKWQGMSMTVGAVREAVDRLELGPSAFFIGDANTALHWQTYRDFQAFMSTVLGGAAVEFGQLSGALTKIADAYDTADKVVALDLNTVYSH